MFLLLGSDLSKQYASDALNGVNGTLTASSPRFNNKSILPLILRQEVALFPGALDHRKRAGLVAGLPHLVDVPVSATADPLDELVVMLRVPP